MYCVPTGREGQHAAVVCLLVAYQHNYVHIYIYTYTCIILYKDMSLSLYIYYILSLRLVCQEKDNRCIVLMPFQLLVHIVRQRSC